MKIRLEVSFNDGTSKKVESVFADFVAFERTWNRSVTELDSQLRLTDLAWLAWHSEVRRTQTRLGFDPEWVGTIDNIQASDEKDTDSPNLLDQQQE